MYGKRSLFVLAKTLTESTKGHSEDLESEN